MNIAKKYSLFVIEDNCEALGGMYKKKLLGNLGTWHIQLRLWKIITTGEGELITTNKNSISFAENTMIMGTKIIQNFLGVGILKLNRVSIIE